MSYKSIKRLILGTCLIAIGLGSTKAIPGNVVHAQTVKNETDEISTVTQKQTKLPVIKYEGTASSNPTLEPETDPASPGYGMPKGWKIGFTTKNAMGLDEMDLTFQEEQSLDLSNPTKVYDLTHPENNNSGRIQYIPGGGINLGTFGTTKKRFGLYQKMTVNEEGGRYLIGVYPSYAVNMIQENDNYDQLITGGNTFYAFTSLSKGESGEREILQGENLTDNSYNKSFAKYLDTNTLNKIKNENNNGEITVGYEVGSNSTTLQTSGAAFLKDFQVFQADLFEEVSLGYFPFGANLEDCVSKDQIQQLIENGSIKYAGSTAEQSLKATDFDEDAPLSFDGFLNDNLQIDYSNGQTNARTEGYFWGQISGNYQGERKIGIVKINYSIADTTTGSYGSTKFGGPSGTTYFEDIYSYLNIKGNDSTPRFGTSGSFVYNSVRSAMGISFVQAKKTGELYMNLFYGNNANHVLPFSFSNPDQEFLNIAIYQKPDHGENTITPERVPEEEISFKKNQVPADYRNFGENGVVKIHAGDLIKVVVPTDSSLGINYVGPAGANNGSGAVSTRTSLNTSVLIKPKEYLFVVTENKQILSFSGINQFLPKKDPVDLNLLTTNLTPDSISTIFNYWCAPNSQFKQLNGLKPSSGYAFTNINDTAQSPFLETKKEVGSEDFPYFNARTGYNNDIVYPSGVVGLNALQEGEVASLIGQMSQQVGSTSPTTSEKETLKINYQIPFQVKPFMVSKLSYNWSFLSPNWLDYDTSVIPAASSFFMMSNSQTKVVDWSSGVRLKKNAAMPLGVEATTQGEELLNNVWTKIASSAAIVPTTQVQGEYSEWIKVVNIGFYEGRSIDVTMALHFDQPLTSTSDFQKKWYLCFGPNNFGRAGMYNQKDEEHVSYSFTDSYTGEPVAISGFATSEYMSPFSWKMQQADVLNYMSYGRTAVPKGYTGAGDSKYFPNNSLVTTGKSTQNGIDWLTFGSIAKRGDRFIYSGYNGQGTIIFAKAPTWNVYPSWKGSTGSSLNILSKAPARVEIPNPGDQNRIIDTVDDQTTIDYGFNQMIPSQDTKYQDRQMKWTWEDAVYRGEGPSPFDLAEEWTITDQDGIDVITNSDEKKNYFDWIKDENDRIIGAELKDPKTAAFYGKMYQFKRKLSFNGKEVNVKDLEEDGKGHSYLTYGGGKVKFEVENQGTYENEFSTKVNFSGKVSYYALTDDKTPKPLPIEGVVNSEDGLVETISTPTILTHAYPEEAKLPGFAGYRLVRQTPTQLAPTVSITDTIMTGYYEEAPIAAVAKPQTYLLGDKINAPSAEVLHDWISEVEIVNEDDFEVTDYTVKWISPTAGTVVENISDDYTITVEVTAQGPNGPVTGKVSVPVTVSMGHSIVVGGSGTKINARESTMAYTLHKDEEDQYSISATYGKLATDDLTKALGITYQMKVVSMNKQTAGQEEALTVENGPQGTTTGLLLNATENQTPKAMLDTWKKLGQLKDGKLPVELGDLIWVYVSNEDQLALYQDNKGPNFGWQKTVTTLIAVVTEDGFSPLYANQLQPKEEVAITPAQSADQDAYDAFYQGSLSKFFNTPADLQSEMDKIRTNGFVPGITNYPNQAKPIEVGEKFSGNVYVAQPNGVNNKWIKIAYKLEFVGREAEGGVLDFQVPTEMDFGDILVPKTGFGILGKSKYLQSVDPAWGIAVTDTRPADQRKPYTLTAQVINQSFEPAKQTRDYQGKSGENEYTNDQIPLVSNILNFAMESGKPLSLGEPVVIYDTGNTPKDDPNYKIQWDHLNTGFLVDLKAFGNYPEGTYQATIDFTVEYGME